MADGADARLGWRAVVAGRISAAGALLVLQFLAGAETYILTAVMPIISHDLQGIALYGLAFSVYPFASLLAIPFMAARMRTRGSQRAFAEGAVAFVAGTILAAAAPSMPLFVAARGLQGFGSAALAALSYGILPRVFPAGVRARVLTLMFAAFAVAGVVGPGLGAALTSTVGWRWTLLVVLVPLAVVAVLLVPLLGRLGTVAIGGSDGSVRWSLQLAVGVAVVVSALTLRLPFVIPGMALGMAVLVPSVGRALPSGTLRATAGLPAVTALAFLINFAFFTNQAFVPLLLTGLGHRSIAAAGAAITASAITYTLGSWLQSRWERLHSPATVVRCGVIAMLVGIAGCATLVGGAPALLVYPSWGVCAFGMGLAHPTVIVIAMRTDESGGNGIGPRLLAGRLGTILGTGIGGGFIAITVTAGLGLRAGLGGGLAITALAASVALIVVARIDDVSGARAPTL